ncbi:ankyrin repeat domain-containing protein 12 isoform X2 [Culicoides brevitarsis]|uniref:ankyrin repeat domain-containing protein 12 isoform X2 n=1 Tax=Culicoides brevitarsis TaxID=469753 RepID=UPI00307C2CE0
MPATSKPRANPSSSRSGVPAAPMSERQQMALVMQMTSTSQELSPGSHAPARSRDRNERGETALHVAAIKGDHESVRKLLDQGMDANVTDFAGWTPLHEACNHSHYSVANILIKGGADVNAKAFEDTTPLHDAALVGNLKLVKLLIEKGADLLAKNRKGKTPCDMASSAVYSYMNQAKETAMNRCGQQLKKVAAATSNSDTTKKSSNTSASVSDATENNVNIIGINNTFANTAAKEDNDVYEFDTTKDLINQNQDENIEEKSEHLIAAFNKISDDQKHIENETAGTMTNANSNPDSCSKRTYIEIEGNEDQLSLNESDDIKKKRRKEIESCGNNKEILGTSAKVGCTVRVPVKQEKVGKTPGPACKTIHSSGKTTITNDVKKSPCSSPKLTTTSKSSDSDNELEDGSINDGPKVPPLKIVIPQHAGDTGDLGNLRNGKNSSTRNHPYVVASNSNESTADKESSSSRCNSPVDPLKNDEKSDKNLTERPPRVLRSSHRTGGQSSSSADRSSNNSSPQPHNNSSTPSPAPQINDEKGSNSQQIASPTTQSNNVENEKELNTHSLITLNNTMHQSTVNSNELHPRKRKIKASKEQQQTMASIQDTKFEEKASDMEVHPHDQPITNCYQMYINLRKQIDRRLRSLFPVQPKPPQGFKDYLLNRRTYVLHGKTTDQVITIPSSIHTSMKELFVTQEKERYKLKMQHIVEKEKLVLAVEQEILRVHGRAARALANQSLPFSVCSILKEEEVYNVITPEQEQKDLNARSRYNGRLFLSWLQDVDDKWEKIKEAMLLRHHNEAESLHAVQRMDWEWKLKELSLCEWKTKPEIDEIIVPQVHVSDDFDLLPA